MSERLRNTVYPDVRVERPTREGCRCDSGYRHRHGNLRSCHVDLRMGFSVSVPWWSCLLVFLLLPTLVWCAPKRLPRELTEDDSKTLYFIHILSIITFYVKFKYFPIQGESSYFFNSCVSSALTPDFWKI